MNWRSFLFLPLAALALGDPVNAPKLKPGMPEKISSACSYEPARRNYLFAYAYRAENSGKAKALCVSARELIEGCGAEASILRERIKELCDLDLLQ